MGVFSKLKNIFYDEEYIEETEVTTKKEEKQEKPKVVEIEEEKKQEEKEENTFSERELFRTERTFNFTEFDDEEELPPRRNVLDLDKTPKSSIQQTQPVEPPRVFKPSPVISPIYGILDKNYVKEEVVSRPIKKEERPSGTMTYDSVRRKAYGTLEDELEDTLNSMNKITAETISESVNDIDASIKELDDKTSKIEDLIGKIENSTISIGELEEKAKDEMFCEDEEELENKTMTDSTLEHDLFNLIDSMYDDKED